MLVTTNTYVYDQKENKIKKLNGNRTTQDHHGVIL